MKASLFLFIFFGYFVMSTSIALAQLQPGQPVIKITKAHKLETCPSGGFILEEGYVKAIRNTSTVDIVVYLQHYHGDWERKIYQRKGSGPVSFRLSSCDYTGNYYVFAVYTETGLGIVPTKSDIIKKHGSLGGQPKFRLLEKRTLENCQDGPGVEFVTGEIFTPAGEEVELTVFLEKKDGTWRKKHFKQTGSGPIPLNIADCGLSGNYRIRIQFAEN